MRYEGERRIPEGFSKRQTEEIEDMIRELEHQFTFVDEFGEKALLIWKRINEERGAKKGKYLIEKYGIDGHDIIAINRLIESYLDEDPERTARPNIRLEEDKLIIESKGFCPLMVSAKILNIDMSKTCPFSTRPYFLAMCKAVNPNIMHKNMKWRAFGDEVCQEIFWIEE